MSSVLITFNTPLNRINEITGLAMESKANCKIEFVNRLLDNLRIFVEPINFVKGDNSL
jgi:hypothetical protein